MKNLVQKIEAILFYLAEPVSANFVAKILEISKEDVLVAIDTLEETSENRGLRILKHDDQFSLVTAPELSDVMEKVIKEERERDLGRAGIETLSIVAYKGPVSRKEIEYIRGVNSGWALRNLLLRGLVEKKGSKHDERVVVYTVTADTVRYLGLGNISELPEYEEVKNKLKAPEEDPASVEVEEQSNA